MSDLAGISAESRMAVQLQCSEDFSKVNSPFRTIISGPTLAGKSQYILSCIKHRSTVFAVTFENIYFCSPKNEYATRREYLTQMSEYCPDVHYIEGLPKLKEIHYDADGTGHQLVIVDDLGPEALDSAEMLGFMTKFSHHYRVSILITLQNIFTISKFGKTFFRQASEIVLFYDRTDTTQYKTLSQKMFPSSNFLINCFRYMRINLPKQTLKYLFIDCSNISLLDDDLKVRTAIFPEEVNGVPRPIFFFSGKN